MNKTELVSKISEDTKLSKTDVEKFLKSFTSTVTEAMANGEDVQLIGFGTFTTSKRAERTGKNPKTGESLVISACTAPKLKFGKAVKDAVNK